MNKIRQSARDEDCTLRIPGVCRGDNSTVVLCHAPFPGRGGMRTGNDTWAAYGCDRCHSLIDGREQVILTDEYAALMWMPAIHETQVKLKAKGLM